MIQELLHKHNPYVRIYMQAGEALRHESSVPFNIVIKADVRTDRTKNKPTCNEIAVLMVEDDQQNVIKRDIVLQRKTNQNKNDFNSLMKMSITMTLWLIHSYTYMVKAAGNLTNTKSLVKIQRPRKHHKT